MKQKINFSIVVLFTVIVLGIITYSCTNSDSNTNETVAPVSEINETPNMNTETVLQPDMVKPNPAKKGMKGKVTVDPMPAAENPPLTKSGEKIIADESGVYPIVEIMASFPDGNKGLQNYFNKNLDYPIDASNEGVDGTVRVSFIVDEKGKLIAPQVVGGKLGYGLEEEALRVINKMPAWNPAQVKGKNVKTRVTLPIRFELS